MAGGRPTLYTPELLTKAYWYLDNWETLDAVPQLVTLALYLDISEETLHTWRKEEGKEEFSELCTRVLGIQKRTLLNGGLKRKFDPTITRLGLYKHGYVEKQDLDVKSDGKAIQGFQYITPP